MANTYHDQLTGSDLHANKIDATTGTELTTASQAIYDNRWTRQSRAVNTSAPLTGGGSLTMDRTLSIPPATAAVDGYLTAANWTAFNAKQPALGYTPVNKAGDTMSGLLTAPLRDSGGQVYNAKAFGAVGDGKQVFDGSMASGSPILTSATAGFASGDIGKIVIVTGAGGLGNGSLLYATIQAYISTTQVTLSSSATHTVSSKSVVSGTNDFASLTSACTAAASKGGTVLVPVGMYVLPPVAALILPKNVCIAGTDREGSIIIGSGLASAAYGSGSTLRDVTIDTNNWSAAISLNLLGSDNLVHNVHFKNWGRFAVDFAFDATASVGCTNSYLQYCIFDHNGLSSTNGGTWICEGAYKYIHILHNTFRGALTNNGCAFEVYIGPPFDESTNVGLFIRDNVYAGLYGKNAYIVGRFLRMTGNTITNVEISSGFGTESGAGTIATYDVDIAENVWVKNGANNTETRLIVSPSSVATDTGILSNVRIHDNQFGFGGISASASAVNPAGGNFIYDLQIYHNSFVDAYTSSIFIELDGKNVTFDGLIIADNAFLNWRAVNSSSWAAIAFASVSGVGTITFIRSQMRGNTFGPARSGNTNAIKLDVAASGSIIGPLSLFNNEFSGYSLVDISPSVLSYLPIRAASIATALATKTAAYTLTATDSVILADATSAAFSVTLPSAAGITGRQYTIKRVNSSSNNVGIGTTSSQLIDGVSTKTLGAQNSAATLVSDGANWQIVNLVGTVN